MLGRTVGKRVVGVLFRNGRRTAPCFTLPSARNDRNYASTSPSADSVDNFINELVTKTIPSRTILFSDIQQQFVLSPPTSTTEVCKLLSLLRSHQKFNSSNCRKFLSSPEIVASLSAHLLDTKITEEVLQAFASFFLMVPRPYNFPSSVDNQNIVHSFNTFCAAFMQRIATVKSSTLLQCSPKTLIDFLIAYSSFAKRNSDVIEFTTQAIMSNLSQVDDITDIMRLIRYLNLSKLNEQSKIVLLNTIEDLIPSISDESEFLGLLEILCAQVRNLAEFPKHRRVEVFSKLAEHIRRQDVSSMSAYIRVLKAMEILNFNHPRLIATIANYFVRCPTHEWGTLVPTMQYFKAHKINNPEFWQAACRWMNALSQHVNNSFDRKSLDIAVTYCAHVGIPRADIDAALEICAKELENSPAVDCNAMQWLNLTHSLAILGNLPFREASKALQPGFFAELKRISADDRSAYRHAMRLIQLASAVENDDGRSIAVPDELISFVKEREHLAGDVRYFMSPNSVIEYTAAFRSILNLIANAVTHVSNPTLHLKTGAYIDARLFVNKKAQSVVPLKAADSSNANIEEVAVIYGADNFFMRVDAGGTSTTRPVGEISMNIRHLRNAKVRPVFITQYELDSFSSPADKLAYVRQKIFNYNE